MQPIQQQGRRFPSESWLIILWICSCRVSSFFTEMTQQIHSLRARGVRLSQSIVTFLFKLMAFFKSSGTL
jgi:hypothetical protein